MKIGYVVEGSTDEAFLVGIRDRWCPDAELIALAFRGSRARHREYRNIMKEAGLKEIDIVVFLTDCNNRDWNTVRREEREQLDETVLLGVSDRNIECWLCADADYIANRYAGNQEDISVEDPKMVFQTLLGITRDDKKATEIAALVYNAPLKNWINNSRSFAHFYRDARALANSRGCHVPDESKSSRNKKNPKSR